MSEAVTVDTLFFACLENRADDLRQLCQEGHAHFLNETLKNESNGITFTMVYSYLERVEGKPDYDVMEALYDCGADFNCRTVRPDPVGTITDMPLLQFAVQVWKNPELVAWLTAHDADPDATIVITSRGVIAKQQTMLRLAIDMNCYDREVLIALLKGGADPNAIADTIPGNGELPAIFFAIVANHNTEQAAILLKAGASLDFTVGRKGGLGFLAKMMNLDFAKYCAIEEKAARYPYTSYIEEALALASQMGDL